MTVSDALESTDRKTDSASSEKLQTLNAWFVFVVASVLLFAYSYHAIRALLYGKEPYRVFGSFWASGWAASHHLNPYGIYPLTWRFHILLHDQGPIVYDVNLSPPWMLPLFQLAAHFPLRAGIILWTIASCLLFISGAAILLVTLRGKMQKRQILWLLFASGVTETLWLGQDYSIMFVLACLAWWLITTRRIAMASVFIGILIAMKPNLGLWPVLMLVAGYKRPALLSASVAALLSALPAFLYGPSIYSAWLHAAAQDMHGLLSSDLSLAGIFARLGSRLAGIILAIVLALGLVVFVRRERPSISAVSGLAVCAGIFCAPLAWFHYVLIAAPFFAARRWGTRETWAALLLVPPQLFEHFVLGRSRLGVLLISLPHIVGVALMLWSFLEWDRNQNQTVAKVMPAPETHGSPDLCER